MPSGSRTPGSAPSPGAVRRPRPLLSLRLPIAPQAAAGRRIAALAAAAALSGCGRPQQGTRSPAPGEPVLTVATYNVNFGLAGDPETLAALGATDADLVAIEETTPVWEAAIRREYGARYPHMEFRDSPGAGGIGVISRYPITETEDLAAPSGWFPALRLVVEGPFGPVQLLAVHLRPPVGESGSVVSGYFTTRPVRRREILEYLEHLAPDLPTVVLGDLNEAPGGAALGELEARGFTSALPAARGRVPTWRWATSIGTVRSQLDHVLHDGRLEALEVRVLDEGRSDHLPVVALLAARDPS